MVRGTARPRNPLALAGIAACIACSAFAQPLSAPGSAPLGYIDVPDSDAVVAQSIVVSGWALDMLGLDRVDVLIDGVGKRAEYGLERPDVAQVHAGYPGAAHSGFIFRGDFTGADPQRHELAVVVVGRNGRKQVIGRRSVVPPEALHEWSSMLDASPARGARPFDILMMTSGVASGGASEIDTAYRQLVSRTQRVGMAVPILYMRTTSGAAGDWTFDPAFDLTRTCGKRPVADDNLEGVIAIATAKRVPVQFILNGGIWGDAACESREWDLTDHLQLDERNVQWSQGDRTFPDDYLKNLAGSTQSPLLARSLTYHVHAREVRAYKKRNLQAAARIVGAFARAHPDLFVGVVLDSDTYMNPFFEEREVFDYNPGMLRQFREWLSGTGPYAGEGDADEPDLRAYRREPPLTLAEVNRIARRSWSSWGDVEPPRRMPGFRRDPLAPGARPVWTDPWWREWDTFRKHVVDLHYDELSAWVRDAGIPSERIYSAQGFVKPDPGKVPVNLSIASAPPNYDSAGVSVEGAIPSAGQLGVIVYGPAARNEVRMETGRSMFAEFARRAPGWGVVEYNAADLRRPHALPTYRHAYATFRDLFNYDASEVSTMAWNGINGIYAGEPGYVSYTSWRNTPAEEAMRDFLVSHADLPRGAQLWTFGSARHADDDGWTATRGSAVAGKGHLDLKGRGNAVTLVSPADLVVRPRRIERIELKGGANTRIVRAKAFARAFAKGAWRAIGTSEGASIALAWPPDWLKGGVEVQQLRLDLDFVADPGPARLRRIALYPACAEIACDRLIGEAHSASGAATTGAPSSP